MNKFTIAAIIAILAGFSGLVIWSSVKPDDTLVDYSSLNPKIAQEASDLNGQIPDHQRGKADSKVTVVEYADMMCAGCAGATQTMDDIYKEYGDRVNFVFRHFPIEGHPNSRSAAAAVESASLQGYFWPMIDAIYLQRDVWLQETGSTRTEAYVQLFKQIAPEGNVDEFRKKLGSEEIEKKINSDRALGDAHGVDATPYFLVNNRPVDMMDDSIKTQKDIRDRIVQMIEEELAEAGEAKKEK